MPSFSVCVEHYMNTPVLSVGESTPLTACEGLMRENDISSLAVVSADDALLGLLTRTDLLRVGKRQAATRGQASLLTFPPSVSAGDAMTTAVETVAPDTPCAVAAKVMVKKRYHRLFVQRDDALVGVISPRDLMQVIVASQVNKAISTFMSAPLFSVRVDDPISLATERLGKAKVTGLIVVEGDFPVGVFTQREALEWKDAPRDTAVERTMSPAMLCLETVTPIHRAAAMAGALGVRRVVAMKNRRAVGILTGLDFAAALT